MYSITKVLNPGKGYSCCFRQWRAASHCRWCHGYDLIFEFTLECKEEHLTEHEGWVYDYGKFKLVKQWLDDTFDHKLIVAEDDPALDELSALAGVDAADVLVLPHVGCEFFARYVYDRVRGLLDLRPGLVLKTVTVRENESNSASYTP